MQDEVTLAEFQEIMNHHGESLYGLEMDFVSSDVSKKCQRKASCRFIQAREIVTGLYKYVWNTINLAIDCNWHFPVYFVRGAIVFKKNKQTKQVLQIVK